MKRLFLGCISLAYITCAQAGAFRWIGRDSKTMAGLPERVISVLNTEKGLFVETSAGGLAVSRDAGKTFEIKTTRDGLGSNAVTGFASSDEGILYVGTTHGVSRSRDGGKTFQTGYLAKSTLQQCDSPYVHTDPQSFFKARADRSGRHIFALFYNCQDLGRIAVSKNGGESFDLVGAWEGFVDFDVSADGTLFVINTRSVDSSYRSRLMISRDFGTNWSETSLREDITRPYFNIEASLNGSVLAIHDNNLAYYSKDGGLSFSAPVSFDDKSFVLFVDRNDTMWVSIDEGDFLWMRKESPSFTKSPLKGRCSHYSDLDVSEDGRIYAICATSHISNLGAPSTLQIYDAVDAEPRVVPTINLDYPTARQLHRAEDSFLTLDTFLYPRDMTVARRWTLNGDSWGGISYEAQKDPYWSMSYTAGYQSEAGHSYYMGSYEGILRKKSGDSSYQRFLAGTEDKDQVEGVWEFSSGATAVLRHDGLHLTRDDGVSFEHTPADWKSSFAWGFGNALTGLREEVFFVLASPNLSKSEFCSFHTGNGRLECKKRQDVGLSSGFRQQMAIYRDELYAAQESAEILDDGSLKYELVVLKYSPADRKFVQINAFPIDRHHRNVSSLRFMEDGRLLVTAFGGVFYVLDLQRQLMTRYGLDEGISTDRVYSTLPIAGDKVLLATDHGVAELEIGMRKR